MSTTNSEKVAIERKVFYPEYAGLRGLAVGLVVIYHIWFNKVSGGVDVFLMLSAFFLTLSMWRQVERGKQFSLSNYWRKVSARIVPATALITIAVVIATVMFLPGNRHESIFKQATATILFGQNFQLAGMEVDYYNTTSAIASPLQHFWSLSIQGQFYLIWPLLILLLVAVGLRTRTSLSWALAVIGGLSFGYALYSIAHDPQATYFSSTARWWEFAFGGILALTIPTLSRTLAATKTLRIVLGWVGAVGLFSAGMLLEGAHFPGWASLLPLLSAAAIMVSGNTGSRYGFDVLLRSRTLQFVAKHAYSLFLWHWPVLIFLHKENSTMTFFSGLVIIAIALGLSVITTNFIIEPLARVGQHQTAHLKVTALKSFTKKSPLAAPAVAAMALTLIAAVGMTFQLQNTQAKAAAQTPEDNPGAAVLQKEYVFEGDPAALIKPLGSQMHQQWAPSGERCDPAHGADHPQLVNCFIYGEANRSEATKTIIAVGDSHIEQWMSALAPVAEERNWQLMRLHRPGCRFTLPGIRYDSDQLTEELDGCDEYREAASKFILERDPDVVFTLATISHKPDPVTGEYPPETIVPGWEKAVEPFLEAGIHVVAQRDTPRAARNVAECVDVRGPEDPRCAIDPAEALAPSNPLEALETEPHIGIFEMTDLLCPTIDGEQSCPPVIGNVTVYLDQHHLTRDYVSTTTAEFEKRFDSALE